MPKQKIGKVSYDTFGPPTGKFVRCPIEIKPDEYLTIADVEAILKKEFRGIPRKNITFSIDSCHLYFGIDKRSVCQCGYIRCNCC